MAVTGRLGWGVDGSCWAFRRCDGMAYTVGGQTDAIDRLTGAVAGLDSDWAMWGMCEPIDPADLRATIAAGGRNPEWVDATDAAVARMNPERVQARRAFYLAARMKARYRPPRGGGRRACAPPARVVAAGLAEAETWDRKVSRLAGRAATAEEIVWLVERTLTRGSADLPVGLPTAVLSGEALAEMGDCWVVNGGRPTGGGGGPRFARWARVEGPYGEGFQATLAVEDVPQRFQIPGGEGEWLHRVACLEFPVDWHLRGTVEPAHTALSKVRWKLRQIAGQHDELAGDAAAPPPSLAEAWHALKRQETEIARTGHPQHVWGCTITVAASTPAALEARVGGVLELFAGQDYRMVRRLGQQRGLLAAQLPCAPFRRGTPLWRYRQHSGPSGVVGAAPMCGAARGDPAGMLLAVDLTSGLRSPLHWQAGYAASIDRSPSIIIAGELGAGKSLLGKRLVLEGLIPAGGRFVGIDATRSVRLPDGSRTGEWVHLASLAGVDAEIVDVVAGGVSADPLSMGMPALEARTLAVETLSIACGFDADSRETDVLWRAVTGIAAAGGRTGEIGGVLAGWGDPVSLAVRDRLDAVAGYMPALFDVTRRPPRLDARFLVFAVWGLTMPSHLELTNPQLTRAMSRRKRCGQATLLLVTALAKHVGWTTPGSCLIGIEEAWRVTASPYGADLLNEVVTEGRRYDCGLVTIVQHVGRLTEEMRSFAGQTFGFRCSGDAAAALAQHLGVPVETVLGLADVVDETGRAASGVCLWSTARRDLNLVHVLRPSDPELDRATDTTPDPAEEAAA